MGNDRSGTGAETVSGPGYALLLAAGPVGKQRLMDATAALPQLAAVPPAALLGTPGGASVVQLVDPVDPQTVLTHLRTAAAHPGPVLVHLTGQLTLDAKQRLPHVALARTAPRTVRYTALPWHWLAAELGGRPPGSTVVVADLVADETAWPLLRAAGPYGLAAGLTLYGTVAPARPKRGMATPGYSRAFAGLLRAAAERPPFALLHQRAAAEAGLGGGPELLLDGAGPDETYAVPAAFAPEVRPAGPVAAGPAPLPPGTAEPFRPADSVRVPAPPAHAPAPGRAPVPDPHAAIHAAIFEAANAGRHSEAASMAAAWEQEAFRTAGPRSAEAIHWLEVRADLSRIAGDPARACELWLAVADARLGNGEPAGHPEVEGAVDRAHHQWQFVQDRARAAALAPLLLDLRGRVPGRRPGALEAVRRRAELLRSPAQTG
ncbi:hypothetical protein PS467_19820 [Streptomyces luomodiensis]|uniref:Uncharacterized protein n=1 Tax=Streptomyces luomodiensis TaxID=3026192 RepID=A0ABY9UY30_9ACTN|nr:hypothetical protein [Streptomyces sp. SCA4-21]WNE97418.1 hypothetical protein PS467_19820 [Streptomyces sp. SCA4-21]